MPLDSKWLVCFPQKNVEEKKKARSCVKIIHHLSVDMLVSVTGCHRRQTDPQNLWKETQLIHSS